MPHTRVEPQTYAHVWRFTIKLMRAEAEILNEVHDTQVKIGYGFTIFLPMAA